MRCDSESTIDPFIKVRHAGIYLSLIADVTLQAYGSKSVMPPLLALLDKLDPSKLRGCRSCEDRAGDGIRSIHSAGRRAS